MKRRDFITLLGGARGVAARGTRAAAGDAGDRVARRRRPTRSPHLMAAFRQGLAEAGYVEGQNVAIEYRWAEGRLRSPAGAGDRSRSPSGERDRHAGSTAAALAAKAATATIPIVFGVGGDPVKLGLVASLNRPGGNATGVNFFTIELMAKRMQLLRELVPAAKRVAVLVNPTDRSFETTLRDVEAAAIGQQVVALEAATGREIDAAFEGLEREKVDALFVSGGAFFAARRAQLAILAARYALPAIYSQRLFVEVGGLMSYGTRFADNWRQVGLYTARVLKGAKPADLPVSQPTKFELVINLNTARALASKFRPRCSHAPTR